MMHVFRFCYSRHVSLDLEYQAFMKTFSIIRRVWGIRATHHILHSVANTERSGPDVQKSGRNSI